MNPLIDVCCDLLDTHHELQTLGNAGGDDAILNLQMLISEKLTVEFPTGTYSDTVNQSSRLEDT